nr:retrotransposon protein, putative, Ty1-copia subclass [Tanacetum cinerariifolium]
MEKKIGELHAMLIKYEKGLSKKAETPQVMIIKCGKIQKFNKKSLKAKGKGKANGKGKDKQVYIPKPKTLSLLLKRTQLRMTPATTTKRWVIVYDTSCGTHICNTKHGLGGVRKLKQEEAIGNFDLDLPNGLVICLDNCHYVPSITRGIYEIDMHNLVQTVNSIYNVSTKRAKHNLDSTYLWHCRLVHISKKRIEKLQQEGLLKSTDDKSFDQCVSCSSVKMTRKSFPHRPERATDLLGIIHTDVYGPLRHVLR